MKTLYSLFLCAGLFLLPSVSTLDAQTEVPSPPEFHEALWRKERANGPGGVLDRLGHR